MECIFALFEKNLPLGIKLLCDEANNGSAKSQTFLGTCYEYGHGVDTNAAEAVRWYRKAAGQGYADAQYRLGICYLKGIGVDKDDEESAKWFRKSAEQYHLGAQIALQYFFGYAKG